ncbi:MAG: hypothetical protein ACKOXB_02365 [Flavobacteriales bacterium]
MKHLRILFFILLAGIFNAEACECPELHPLTLADCGRYEVIFEGRIDSIAPGNDDNDTIAYFTINKLFKGNFLTIVPLHFDGEADCPLYFQKGETWIIYAEKNNAQEARVEFCSRTRKMPAAGEDDMFLYNSVYTYNKELQMLAEFFPDGEKASEGGLQPRKYEKVDPVMIPLLMGISLAFIIVGLYFFRKKK